MKAYIYPISYITRGGHPVRLPHVASLCGRNEHKILMSSLKTMHTTLQIRTDSTLHACTAALRSQLFAYVLVTTSMYLCSGHVILRAPGRHARARSCTPLKHAHQELPDGMRMSPYRQRAPQIATSQPPATPAIAPAPKHLPASTLRAPPACESTSTQSHEARDEDV